MNNFALSKTFINFHFASGVAQAACVATSPGQGAAFFLSRSAGAIVSRYPPLSYIPYIPSKLVNSVANQNSIKKIAWTAPVSGIIITSLAAYKIYAVSTSFIAKGFICGVHSAAMLLLVFAPLGFSQLGLITLKDSFEPLILNPNRFTHIEEQTNMCIERRAEIVASAALLVSSVSLTVVLQNPILANTAAYCITALVKVVAMRGLQELAIR